MNEVYLNQDGIVHCKCALSLSVWPESSPYIRQQVLRSTYGIFKFSPTPTGLHVLDLEQHPQADHLLVTASNPPTTEHVPVNTVRDTYEGFTKQLIQQAQEARRLMLMTGIPSEHVFLNMVQYTAVPMWIKRAAT